MGLEYRIHGRRVSESEWQKHLDDSARDIAVEALKKKVGNIRCPTHGQTAKLVVGAQHGDRLEMKIQACCDDLLKRAQRAVA
jgi:hypothetical protein